jgi:hypothetical protein
LRRPDDEPGRRTPWRKTPSGTSYLSEITHLLITGIDLDLGWMSGLPNLMNLGINGTFLTSANLATLEKLRIYAGTLQGCESVFRVPNLAEAAVDEVREGRLPAIRPSCGSSGLPTSKEPANSPPTQVTCNFASSVSSAPVDSTRTVYGRSADLSSRNHPSGGHDQPERARRST